MTSYQLQKYHLPEPPYPVQEGGDGKVKRHIGLLSKREDFACCLLACLGQGTKVIMRVTGLTTGQVGYRLKKAHIKIRAYSRGESIYSQMVIRNVANLAARQTAADVEQITDVKL